VRFAAPHVHLATYLRAHASQHAPRHVRVQPYSVHVVDSYAYVVGYWSDSLAIIDVSNAASPALAVEGRRRRAPGRAREARSAGGARAPQARTRRRAGEGAGGGERSDPPAAPEPASRRWARAAAPPALREAENHHGCPPPNPEVRKILRLAVHEQ
jgi:hypothetical protein